MTDNRREAAGKLHDIMCLPDDADIAIARKWAAEARAALDAAPQAAVVKPLVWVKHPSADIWRVDTIIGTYKVFGTGPSPSWDFDGLTEKVSHVCMIVDEGFSAAQAHHDARIFSAINFTPASPLSAVVAYERAAEAMAQYHWNRYADRKDGGTLSSPAVFSSHTHQHAVAAIRALSAEIPAADLLKAALALPEVAAMRDALKFYAPKEIDGVKYAGGDDGGTRAAAALARLKGSQP